jgi:dolichyl-phosphate-mannose-protein mannosyltransferase
VQFGGQTDPIVNLFGLISIYFLIDKKLVKSLLFLTLSLLFKGSLAIFVPVLLIYAIWQRYNLKTWIKAILVSGIVTTLITVWFHPSFDLHIWLINLYTKQILPGEIGDLSANAFNFWYLINPGKILDSITYFGIPARVLGYLIIIIVMALAILKLQKQKTERRLFFALTIIALTSFLFMTRIHERYLYPFFPVATILIGFLPEFIFPYLVLSFVFWVNMYNLFWAPGIPTLENILKTTSLPVILSITNLTIFAGIFILFLKNKKYN